MRILIVANLYPSKKDPTYGTFVKNFVDGIYKRNRGGKIDLCVIRGRTDNVGMKIIKYCRFYLSILYHLLFCKYDIVYNHIITHAAIPFRLVSYFQDIPLVFNIHGEDLLTKTRTSKILLKIVTPLLYKAKLIVIPSVFFKGKVMETFPNIPIDKLFVSASGGVASSFFRKEKIKTKKQFTLGYVSRIDRGKGWKLFVDSIRMLNKEKYHVMGKIVGTGFQENDLNNYIDESDNIEYIGALAHSKLPSFYSQLDLFIFPTTLKESLGLVGLEAMASHIPVIGSKIGGLTDYIVSGKNGFFFQPNDVENLVLQIKTFMGLDNESKEKMRQEAYDTAYKYSADIIADKMYNKLVSIV